MFGQSQVQQLQEEVLQKGQGHIFQFWKELSYASREKLINQVRSIDFDLLQDLKAKYLDHVRHSFLTETIAPPTIIPLPTSEVQQQKAEQAKKIGENLLREGKVGAILVAGGQGTRLGVDGPKGKFKIGPITGKSLFQMFAERINALNKRYRTEIPWFIMTSETNYQETVAYFQENKFFGLNAGTVYFFNQGMIPALDAQGRVFLDAKDHIFTNPNGHGGLFYALRNNGCFEEMKRYGIEELFYFQVDNVLIKICDPIFMGYHRLENADMSLKIVSKRDPMEKVGVVIESDGKLAVVEYSDFPDDKKHARNPYGSLKYQCGSIGIHAFKREFMEQISSQIKLPYHLAHKKISHLDETGKLIQSATPNGFKFEMFIFDALKETERVVVMEVDRREEFSPVKNITGMNSPATARRDLVDFYCRMLKQIGVAIPAEYSPERTPIEISPGFALDTDELRTRIDPLKFNIQFPLLLEDMNQNRSNATL